MQKRFAFMRSFDSAIECLLNAGMYLNETSAQRKLYELTNELRSYEYEQLEKSDREKDFSRIRKLRGSKRQRRPKLQRVQEGLRFSQS